MLNTSVSQIARLYKWTQSHTDDFQTSVINSWKNMSCQLFFFPLCSCQENWTGSCSRLPSSFRSHPLLTFTDTIEIICDVLTGLSYFSCASLFPESPRWLLATTQIPQVKRSLQELTIRNGVCLQQEIYPGETLLSGKTMSTHRHKLRPVLWIRMPV